MTTTTLRTQIIAPHDRCHLAILLHRYLVTGIDNRELDHRMPWCSDDDAVGELCRVIWMTFTDYPRQLIRPQTREDVRFVLRVWLYCLFTSRSAAVLAPLDDDDAARGLCSVSPRGGGDPGVQASAPTTPGTPLIPTDHVWPFESRAEMLGALRECSYEVRALAVDLLVHRWQPGEGRLWFHCIRRRRERSGTTVRRSARARSGSSTEGSAPPARPVDAEA